VWPCLLVFVRVHYRAWATAGPRHHVCSGWLHCAGGSGLAGGGCCSEGLLWWLGLRRGECRRMQDVAPRGIRLTIGVATRWGVRPRLSCATNTTLCLWSPEPSLSSVPTLSGGGHAEYEGGDASLACVRHSCRLGCLGWMDAALSMHEAQTHPMKGLRIQATLLLVLARCWYSCVLV
jgi:hypothetical protein